MKRDCLLSRAYTGKPLTLNGSEIYYSATANEILREFQTAFFCGDGPGDQTHFHGVAEGLMVMELLAKGDVSRISELREMARQDRHKIVLTFAIENEDEIARLKPEILTRIESAMAATVESEMPGKPQAQALESSP